MKPVLYFFVLIFFCFGLLLPKPDPRIEKLARQLPKKSGTGIIGSSIVNHNGPCDDAVEIYNGNVDFILGDGGLLLEEIEMAISGKNFKNIILITGTYQFAQEDYYPFSTRLYYGDFDVFDSGFLPLTKKPLWAIDKTISFNGKLVTRDYLSKEINEHYSLDKRRCSKKENISDSNSEIFKSVINSTYDNFNINMKQVERLNRISDTVNIKLVLIEPFIYGSTPELNDSIQAYNDNLSGNLSSNIEVYWLNDLPYDFYDEPWCACGHLSHKGRKYLNNTLEKFKIKD